MNKEIFIRFASLVPAKPLNDAQMRGAFLFIELLSFSFQLLTFHF